MAGKGLPCSVCSELKPKIQFSKAQLKKKDARSCLECVAAKVSNQAGASQEAQTSNQSSSAGAKTTKASNQSSSAGAKTTKTKAPPKKRAEKKDKSDLKYHEEDFNQQEEEEEAADPSFAEIEAELAELAELAAPEAIPTHVEDWHSLLSGPGRNYLLGPKRSKRKIGNRLKGKVVGLLWTASAKPCSMFEDMLAEVYKEVNAATGADDTARPFEVVGISWDQSKEQYNKVANRAPWLMLPFQDDTVQMLSEQFQIDSLPALLLFDTKGALITTHGVTVVEEERAAGFPWLPETGPVRELAFNLKPEWMEQLFVLVLMEEAAKEEQERIRGVLRAFVDSHREETPAPMCYVCSRHTLSSLGARNMMGLQAVEEEKKELDDKRVRMAVIDFADQDGARYLSTDCNVTTDSLNAFWKAYKRGEVERSFGSAPRPAGDADSDNPAMMRIVTSSFKELALQKQKIVLVHLYSPMRQASVAVETAAEVLRELKVADVSVAHYSADDNEIDPKYFPTQVQLPIVKAFVRGDTKGPILSGEKLSADGLLQLAHTLTQGSASAFSLDAARTSLRSMLSSQFDAAVPAFETLWKLLSWANQSAGQHIADPGKKKKKRKNKGKASKGATEEKGVEGVSVMTLFSGISAVDIELKKEGALVEAIREVWTKDELMSLLHLPADAKAQLAKGDADTLSGIVDSSLEQGEKLLIPLKEWLWMWRSVVASATLELDSRELLHYLIQELLLPALTEAGTCTFSVTGESFFTQVYFQCLTCDPDGEDGIGFCAACAVICHKGHMITVVESENMSEDEDEEEEEEEDTEISPDKMRVPDCYCDCGAGSFPEQCRAVNLSLPAAGLLEAAGGHQEQSGCASGCCDPSEAESGCASGCCEPPKAKAKAAKSAKSSCTSGCCDTPQARAKSAKSGCASGCCGPQADAIFEAVSDESEDEDASDAQTKGKSGPVPKASALSTDISKFI